jgi:hypothetical protein
MLFANCNYNDQVMENLMGKAWGEEECIQNIGGKARRKETTKKTKT